MYNELDRMLKFVDTYIPNGFKKTEESQNVKSILIDHSIQFNDHPKLV